MRRVALLALVVVACGNTETLPPHGEAVVTVDTDLPVPMLASRFRVDLYSEDGRWIESRDIGRSDPRDWPASFSVYSDDDTKPRDVLVRLRAYPDGVVRDYRGERFADRKPYAEPRVATSLEDLCAHAPELPIGGTVVARRSGAPVTAMQTTSACPLPTRVGSVAAKVTIATEGAYRFSVARAVPYETGSSLFLRQRCEDEASQLACSDYSDPQTNDLTVPGHFPRFEITLKQGTYWLMTGGSTAGWPADMTLSVEAVDALLPAPASTDPQIAAPPSPRLLDREKDITPPSEPVPTAAIDRLLLLHLEPAVRGYVHVVLRGACAGTMARLGVDPVRPDPKTAETCIDTEAVRVPVAVEPLDREKRVAPSVQGSFGLNEPCDDPLDDDPSAPSVCIPGGVFLFGGRDQNVFATDRAESTPERIALVPRFWMDRNEVSVARFRDAVRRGFVASPQRIRENEERLREDGNEGNATLCTWSLTRTDREDLPVTCIAWELAREFCRFEGGDLPAEVQWEYAAIAAGRPFKARFPWGDEDPTCDRSHFGSPPSNIGVATSAVCPKNAPVPEPLTAKATTDVNALGIVNLGGGVAEWMRDAARPLSDPCWTSAALLAPACDEREAPLRSIRGVGWPFPMATSTSRFFQPSALGPPQIPFGALLDTGVRCVYDERRTR